MIRGAYSDKYKAAQNERIQRLKEQAAIEGQIIKDRVKELSKETNRRRRAQENRKKQLEEEEERNREVVLSERRKIREEATQKFQKDYSRKKIRPNSGKRAHQTESPYVLQDGERVVSGHDVEIRNDEQIIVPTLEDALNMVNNPYTVYNEHNMQYYGPEELYNNIDYTQPADLSLHNMNGSDYDYQDDPFEEQIKLRENALQNGGPKLAFMNNECTDGALPKTIGRNSPSGSLTSLDSLDEVPSDCLPGQEKPLQPVPVTGIISKDKGKSTERRRVTFSDSIEFDDGFTGQLVTAEKESCKQYVKQYNSRLATSNAAYNGTKAGVYNTNGGNKATGKVIGTPGNTPVRKVPTNTSASMVVPLSLYSQFSGNKPIASTGQSTSSSNTHADHPGQCVAEVDSPCHSASNDPEYQSRKTGTCPSTPLNLEDSLDILQDSLESNDEHLKQQNELQDVVSSDVKHKDKETDQAVSDGYHGDGYHGDEENVPVHYYGNPTTIYHHPFGHRNTSHDASQAMTPSHQPELLSGYAPELLLAPAGQCVGTDNEGQASYGTNENNTCSSESKLVSKGSANSSYYKSWYPGSFFPSKSYLADDDDDDSVKQDKAIRKSVAYDLIQNVDEEQNVTKYSPKPKDLAKPRDTTSRQSNPGSNVDNSGRINPLGNTAPDVQKEPYNSNEQVKHHIDSSHETRANRMTAKPPHPSTRHKGVVYNSPLHRKRAAVAAKRTAGKHSPNTPARRSPTVKTKETTVKNQRRVCHAGTSRGTSRQVVGTRGNSSSSSEDDEVLQNIRRDMDRISMLSNSSPAQEEHQKILNTFKVRDSPLQTDSSKRPTKADFRSVYKKVHKPRVGSAKQRAQLVPSNRDPPSKIPVYMGPSGNNHAQVGTYEKSNNELNEGMPSSTNQRWTGGHDGTDRQNSRQGVASNEVNGGMPSSTNQRWAGGHDGTDRQNSRQGVASNEVNGGMPSSTNQRWTGGQTDRHNSRQGVASRTNKLIHPQTAALQQSIALDKTPTDDEINILWDRVRTCLSHKDTQCVGSDSCVNRVDVRRAQTGTYRTYEYQDHTGRDSTASRTSRAASIAGIGTVGGLRRYGSQEVLRRYASADNLGPYRQQPLLQQRAQRTRQSGQGKPPIGPQQQMNFSPMSSRQAPSLAMSTRAGTMPLTQNELRAVMKASQQTQQHLLRTHQEQIPEYGRGYQTMMNTRTGPSALSIEENKLLQSLDRLNDRLKAQTIAAVTKRTEQAGQLPNSRHVAR